MVRIVIISLYQIIVSIHVIISVIIIVNDLFYIQFTLIFNYENFMPKTIQLYFVKY